MATIPNANFFHGKKLKILATSIAFALCSIIYLMRS